MPHRILCISYLPTLFGLRHAAVERGAEVVTAMSLSVAMGLLERQKFDAVVLCFAMPRADKVLFTGEAFARGVPVVALCRDEMEVPATASLTGPTDPCSIMDTLEACLGQGSTPKR